MSEELLELLSYLKLRLSDDFFGEMRHVAGRIKLLGASPPSGILETLYLGEVLVRRGPDSAMRIIKEHAPTLTSFLDSIDRKIAEAYDLLYASEIDFARNLAKHGYVNDAKLSALILLDELSRNLDGKTHSPYDVLLALSKTFTNLSADAQSIALAYDEDHCFPRVPCFPANVEELSLESLLKVVNALANSVKTSESRETLNKRIREVEEKRVKEIAIILFPDETIGIINDIHDAVDALLAEEPPSVVIYDNSDKELTAVIEDALEISRSTIIPLLSEDPGKTSLYTLHRKRSQASGSLKKVPAPVYSIKNALSSILDHVSLSIIPSITIKDDDVYLTSASRELSLSDLATQVPELKYLWLMQDKSKLEWLGFLAIALLRNGK